jgi:hypothetical protein
MNQPAAAGNGASAGSHGAENLPPFIMDDVRLLFSELTTPETQVKFSTPTRADPSTIEDSIHPPQATWTWADQAARMSQQISDVDLGKYGLQADTSTLYRLVSVAPLRWEPVRDFTQATWTWPNVAARNAEQVTPGDVGKTGYEVDTNEYFRLASTAPAVWQPVPGPSNTSAPFELSTGAADAESYHDFFRLQIAFEDVWAELLDQTIEPKGKEAYARWDALMDQRPDTSHDKDGKKTFLPAPKGELTGVDELKTFLDNLKIQLGLTASTAASTMPSEFTQLRDAVEDTLKACTMLLKNVDWAALGGWQDSNKWLNTVAGPLNDFPAALGGDDLVDFPGWARGEVFDKIRARVEGLTPSQPTATPEVAGPDLNKEQLSRLLKELDSALKERYRFDVFAPASINYGLLLNYRQRWKPQSYQVGNLVSTIPLAPQETRRYTTKTVVKRTRNVKEISDSVRSGKDESADTWRVDAEIVDRAKNQTSFEANASGSYGKDDLYKISAGMQQRTDQAVESAQTKREFHESVVKAAQEYRNEHRLEISTEETREDETTSFREIRNPNDELTVTYLFYELQRRYLVDELLHKITPVILVANDVPAPHEVDAAWILRHDWILKRTVLDDSFLPALEYLAADYTGAELALQTLGLAVEQQKAVVDRISRQVQAANQSLDTATLGLQAAQSQSVQDQQDAETRALIKSFFDPLNITRTGNAGDGNSDRARVDFAKDALNRAQAKVNQLVSDLKTETTALQTAIDKYVAATTKHFSMLAEIDRLRIHVKDDIIYYMQAIWTYEPADQRYFRLYNLDVPTFGHNSTLTFNNTRGLASTDPAYRSIDVALLPPTLHNEPTKLHQVADLETLLGFKGNYMIFPITNFDNYLVWFMMQHYIVIDDINGVIAADPEPGADYTLQQLRDAMAAIHAKNPDSFADYEKYFEEIMFRLLSKQTPEMVIVPSNSLYIEALPGTHPLLEDFKLIHRAIDVKKAQAEARKAELENLRLGARLANQQLGDPDIERKIIIEGNADGIVVQPDSPNP